MTDGNLVSVVVVPRERFRPFLHSLRSLFSTIDNTVPVIVVDGGAPSHIRQELRALRADRDFQLVECGKFVLPNKARNMGLNLVETKYVAFCDNDLEYWPGWLDALVQNAEANNSVAVAPLTLIGPSNPPLIHQAGGSFVYRKDADGHNRLWDEHHYADVCLSEAEAEKFVKAPVDTDVFEYHCVLMKGNALRDIGGHDERLINHEHLDSSLRLRIANGRITFEQKARVMYLAFIRFADQDWPYFLHRWSLQRSKRSDRIFANNWGIVKDHERFTRLHRERAMFTILPRLPKGLSRGRIKRLLLKFYEPHVLRFDANQSDDEAALVLPRPPANGLEKWALTWRDCLNQ